MTTRRKCRWSREAASARLRKPTRMTPRCRRRTRGTLKRARRRERGGHQPRVGHVDGSRRQSRTQSRPSLDVAALTYSYLTTAKLSSRRVLLQGTRTPKDNPRIRLQATRRLTRDLLIMCLRSLLRQVNARTDILHCSTRSQLYYRTR